MGLTDKLKTITGKVVQTIDQAGDRAVEWAEEKHNQILDRGGYVAAGKLAAHGVAESARNAIRSIEGALYTDGKFDLDKAKALVKDSAAATREYGEEAVGVIRNFITDSAHEAKANLDDRWRRLVPSEEEKRTRYAAVGTTYRQPLLRQSYEDCLAFHANARTKLPRRSQLTSAILSDILESASTVPYELVTFYHDQQNSVGIAKKLSSVAKYLESDVTPSSSE